MRELFKVFTRHAYVLRQTNTEKGSAFTSKLRTELIDTTGIEVAHRKLKHAQKVGIFKRFLRNMNQIQKINVSSVTPHCDKCVNLAVMAHNTLYDQTLKGSSSEIFFGCVPYKALNFKFRHILQQPWGTTDIKTKPTSESSSMHSLNTRNNGKKDQNSTWKNRGVSNFIQHRKTTISLQSSD